MLPKQKRGQEPYEIDTVWFFSTVTWDENIMQKLEELAKFWKKLLEDESLQLFAKRF